VIDSVKHKFEGCRVKSNLCGFPCLVVNKPVEKVCGPYDGAPFTYKQECTFKKISEGIKSNRYYCGITEDEKFINYVIFQAYNISGNPASISTVIDSPIEFFHSWASDQIVVLSGEPAVYGGTTTSSLGYPTPFYEEDKPKPSGMPWVQCKYNWDRMEFNLEEKPDYKALLTVADIPAGKAAFNLHWGTLILRNIKVIATCTLGKCGSIFYLANGARLILDNSEIIAPQDYSPTAAESPHYSNIIEIIAPPDSKLGDFIDFREAVGSDSITDIWSATDSFIKTNKPLIIGAGDFEGSNFKIVGFARREGDNFINEFWNGNSEFIEVYNYPVIECELVTGKKKCMIDNSEGQLKYSTAAGYSHMIYISKAEGAFNVAGNFEIDGTNYVTSLPENFRPDQFSLMTNLGQKIKVVCPRNETMIMREDGVLNCIGAKKPVLTGTAIIVAEGGSAGGEEGGPAEGEVVPTGEEGTVAGGTVLERSEETGIAPLGPGAVQQKEALEGGSFCTMMHAPASSSTLTWLVYMGLGLGALLWRRTRH
jgi:hypothetical protein